MIAGIIWTGHEIPVFSLLTISVILQLFTQHATSCKCERYPVFTVCWWVVSVVCMWCSIYYISEWHNSIQNVISCSFIFR